MSKGDAMTIFEAITAALASLMAAYASVCLNRRRLPKPGYALYEFLLSFSDEDDAGFSPVVGIYGFLVSGILWFFFPALRPVIAMIWYGLFVFWAVPYALVDWENSARGAVVAAVVVMGGVWLPVYYSVALTQRQFLPLLWYGTVAFLACWQVVCREFNRALEYEAALYENVLE